MNVTFFHGKVHKNYYDNLWKKYHLSHKEKIMKITYFVQRKLHKNIIIRLHNATKIDNVIEYQGQSNNFESSEFLF